MSADDMFVVAGVSAPTDQNVLYEKFILKTFPLRLH